MASPSISLESPVRDGLGRGFRKLRLSLNSVCNLACVYCVADGESGHTGPASLLSPEEYAALMERVRRHADIRDVRLTGGEPLLYSGIGRLIALFKERGVERVTLTTNGLLLEKRLDELLAGGLDAVNVSLDTLDPVRFERIARRSGLSPVLRGIEAAARALPVKLNMTVVREFNEQEIVPLLHYAGERRLELRYLELMNMGPLYRPGRPGSALVRAPEILATIRRDFGKLRALGRATGATARRYETGAGQVFGIIANHSAPFCGDCDRLRMDSRGRLYGCLSENRGIALPDGSGESDGADRAALQEALSQKQETHFTGSDLSMLSIGG